MKGDGDSGGRRCLRGMFTMCVTILMISASICFYRYGQDSPSRLFTHQVEFAKETEFKSNPLSALMINMNSTHVNGKRLERVDVNWDKNIYFSVKTTSKYYRERLSVSITTWFQLVNKKMVSLSMMHALTS